MTETYWLKDNDDNLVFAAVLFDTVEHGVPYWKVQFCDGACDKMDWLIEEHIAVDNGGTGLCCSWTFGKEQDARAFFAILKTTTGRARWGQWKAQEFDWPYGDIKRHLAESLQASR